MTFITQEHGVDLAMAAYWDQIGKSLPEIIPREGRRWIIEDVDVISSAKYIWQGRLSPWGWGKSFQGLQEFAFLSIKDPMPWVIRYTCYLPGNGLVKLERLLEETWGV
ncbi:MAG: hypothetical protein U0V70_18510 [Terriglobia bacterium]